MSEERERRATTSGSAMRLSHDIPEFVYAGLPGQLCVTHLRIWAREPRRDGPAMPSNADGAPDAVVIATERPDNSGASITNTAEQWAAAAWRRFLPEHILTHLLWIEHYPHAGPPPLWFTSAERSHDTWQWEMFSEIRFARVQPTVLPGASSARSRQLAGPRWIPCPRAWVEARIGMAFPIERDPASRHIYDAQEHLHQQLQARDEQPDQEEGER